MQLFSSWTGGDFLLFYTLLLGFAMLASWWMPMQLRPSGRTAESLEAEDLALLSGGRARFADSLMADLFVRGGLAEAGRGKLAVVQSSLPASPAGKALLRVSGPISPVEARSLLASQADRVAARLERHGLLLRYEEMLRLRMLCIAPFVFLLVVGLYRQRAGSMLGEPTGALVGLMVVTVLAAVIRLAKFDRRTEGGIATLHNMQDKFARLRLAPEPQEVPLAVALFGTAVLLGTPWEPVHAMLHKNKDGDGGDSSDSDGGSGCGGGCGGCGG
ncbi:TIGR04222 domain-containing membrane protein [Erythrobacter dokdonensis]|jgi:uncharacterized protein (TIGR04222 family)|uniref:TIGR04222 domain-containing membrane protein n=1 Tax=Erythrobacter dokdonensis DSW-74 TaxID=1300349 RepID=A0A1A7BJ26_9SPHN|nr:TIGR04222 domain-containing membrane protein [Erythrobacter dokdonensis]OBV11716.1 hypothetical protein I603_1159 [Erythrobacter dokdonensis DSW-74]